ncbi:hypothetical protein DFJ73DRAFT_852260 [Zopfochytrium polystomum]|nr:hypothetical protein DFJ73DRAFT_852260 [Zopfochytrium polystomum]
MNDQAGGSKNKKKKKPAAKEEPAPEPVAAVPEPTGSGKGKKKPNALVAALQAKLAAEKAAKEEEERRLAEEQRRIEEEEARVAAAEKAKQEAKLARKERERVCIFYPFSIINPIWLQQKKEEQKKAGTYMTPAQIQADRLAKQRLQVMLAQGLKVEGLLRNDENASETPKPKRVVYAKKKKPTGPKVGAETSVASTPEPTPSLVSESKDDEDSIRVSSPTASTKTEEPAASAIKDSWDDSSEDEKPAPIKVTKDSWEEESEEENAAPIMKSSATTKDTLQNKNGASGGKTKVSANNGTAGDTVKPGQTKPVAAKTTANKVAPPNEAQKKIPTAPVKVQAEPDEDEDEDSEEDSEGDSDEESDEDSEDYSDEDSDEDGPKVSSAQRMALMKKQEAQQRKEERLKKALAERSKDNLRSPICAILGHVDTGKTKLLDKIRQTNVQEGEAGGITQQIGATYFPMEAIRQKTAVLKKDSSTYKLPGLLIIDTPGHESFTNLRSRGSSLCNIAILVVDIMHGLEPQTIESIGLLRQRKTPFIVALNKIDRIYGWKSVPDNAVRDSLAIQPEHVKAEFAERVKRTIVEFAEQGLNACLYYENTNFAKYVSLVPTSAITGEGIPDILDLVIDLTQNRLTDRLMYLSELECTVLEVKVIEGLGTTIDVILSNGVLREGDRIVICGLVGPIVTNIRALLTPEPMRELRIKSAYVHHKEVKAALGVKISAPDLEKAIAGSRLMVVGPDDDEDELAEEIMSDFHAIEEDYITRGRGVCVQASTLGSLEALLSFLKSSKIPVSGYNLGPIHKKDIIRTGIMLERHRELALLLAFDVPIDRDAQELADEMGIKVFKADIIYHLFDQFTAHMAALEEQRRRDQAPQAVFPCILRIIPGMVFNKRSPIVMGVDVVEGFLRIGTPICVVDEDKNVVDLGKCTGIELNRKPIQESKRGSPSVSIKLEMPGYEAPRMYGRHFTERNELYSHISRASIDILKSTFKNDLTKEDWATVIKLKKVLKIE